MKTKKRKRSAIKAECDRISSRITRARGFCELRQLAPEVKCEGELQNCHLVRRAVHTLRWDADNLLAGCKAHHVYFTHRPERWHVAVENAWPGLWQMLLDRAQTSWDKDLNGLLERLRGLERTLDE